MNKNPVLIALSTLLIAVPQVGFAEQQNTTDTSAPAAPKAFAHCEVENPYSNWQGNPDIQNGLLKINANDVTFFGKDKLLYNGNVSIRANDMSLKAESAQIDKVNGILSAAGPLQFQNSASIIKSDSLTANFSDASFNVSNAEYELTAQVGRGKAQSLTVSETELVLKDASFTTCPRGKEAWSIEANEIVLSQEEGWGETYGTVIRILDTPVFYLPYFTFPISDKRKTGFIQPTISSSNRYGLEVETPFYWDIAPNLDATITPRYMSNIGVQLKTEMRYLTASHRGEMALEYLDKDDTEEQLGSRYLFNWQQRSEISNNWRGIIDITNISDDNYLTDLGSDYANKTDTQLNRMLHLTRIGDTWQTDIRVQNFQVLGDHQKSYSAYPQINFTQTVPFDVAGLDFTLNGEIAHFKNSQATIDEASRLHIEPKLSFHVQEYAWQFLSELSVLQTNYEQRGDLTNTGFDKRVNRTLPKARVYGQLNFERDTSLLVENGIQTLEPRLQYLYVPKKDQSNIGLYDTAKLQDDFFGLFREQRFSGVDRIANANQFTLGATTRIFNQSNTEVFNLSAGQIFYLSDSAKPTEQDVTNNTNYNALFASEAMVHWHRRWYLSAGVQYDTDGKELINSHVTLDYKGDNNQLVQLNHRFANDVSNNTIEQIGMFASIPIEDSWQFVMSYQRDIEQDRSVELLSGLQYQSCCWAIQIAHHRQIETDLNQDITGNNGDFAAFNSGISIKFVLGLDANKLLSQSIFGYRRPYFLNN